MERPPSILFRALPQAPAALPVALACLLGAQAGAQEGAQGNQVPPAGAGLHPIELEFAATSPLPSVAAPRALVFGRAELDLPIPAIEPGKHIVTPEMVGIVPEELALPLGFLNGYNEKLDALGLAWRMTGLEVYSDVVGAHLLAWGDYAPPNGVGRTEGGEPGVMHRDFPGLFRSAWNAWEALELAEQEAAVTLARRLLVRLDDWWSLTPWVRGNHQAAANLTALHATLLLERARREGVAGVSEAEVDQALGSFLAAGQTVPPASIVIGEPGVAGSVGFERQVEYGVFREELRALYEERYDPVVLLPGASLDYCYKEPESRLEYHSLVLNHWLTTLWLLRRSGLTEQLAAPELVHARIGSAVDFLRSTWESGDAPPGSSVEPGDVSITKLHRENMALALALFPSKSWIAPVLASAPPESVLELYTSVAFPMAESSRRSAEGNPPSLLTGLPILGGTIGLQVDLSTSGHSTAVAFAYDAPVSTALPGGQVLMTRDTIGAGEFLGAPILTSATPGTLLPVAPLPSLMGFRMTVQAVHIGTVFPYALSNACDLVMGVY